MHGIVVILLSRQFDVGHFANFHGKRLYIGGKIQNLGQKPTKHLKNKITHILIQPSFYRKSDFMTLHSCEKENHLMTQEELLS